MAAFSRFHTKEDFPIHQAHGRILRIPKRAGTLVTSTSRRINIPAEIPLLVWLRNVQLLDLKISQISESDTRPDIVQKKLLNLSLP
jgi:hypothetical protein